MGAEFPRPDLRVVGRILETLWRHSEPMRPTALQQASATNYTQFSRYLDFLAARGLVVVREDDHGGRWVALSARGQEAHAFLVTGLTRLFASDGADRMP